MFELFVHGRDKLNQLLFLDPLWTSWMRRTNVLEFKYTYVDSKYHVRIDADDEADMVMVDARLPRSAMTGLDIKVDEKTMRVVQDTNGSTRLIALDLVLVRPTHIAVVPANPTDTGTLDCILEAFVKAIRDGDA